MKKVFYIALIAASFCMSYTSCKKDDPAPSTPTTNDPVIACNGGNLCFNLDGKDYVFSTKLEQTGTNKYRISTIDPASGSDWKRVELYIFGTGTTGDYKFDFSGTDGSASMIYFGNEAGVSFNYYSEDTGTVKLVSIADGKWSGTFTCTMSKKGVSGKNFKLQSGNIAKVGS